MSNLIGIRLNHQHVAQEIPVDRPTVYSPFCCHRAYLAKTIKTSKQRVLGNLLLKAECDDDDFRWPAVTTLYVTVSRGLIECNE